MTTAISALDITLKHWIMPGLERRRQRHAWKEQRESPIRSTIRNHAKASAIRCIAQEISTGVYTRHYVLRTLANQMDGRIIGLCQICQQGLSVVQMFYGHHDFGHTVSISIRCPKCRFTQYIRSMYLWPDYVKKSKPITTTRHVKHHHTTTKPQKIRWQKRP